MTNQTLFDQTKPPSIPKLIELYLQNLEIERDASQHTLINYQIDLRHWISFLHESGNTKVDLKRLTDLREIRQFLGFCTQKYSRTTTQRRLSVIKGFLKFLHKEGYIEKNIAQLISVPRSHQKLPQVLKPDEIIRMIEGVTEESKDLRHLRVRAVLELFYSTGIRLSELVQLNHENVDFHNGFMKIRGKGNKERIVPLGRHCQKAIRDYIDAMPPTQKHGAKNPLFLNRDGERISARSVQRNLKEFALKTLGHEAMNVSPHTFRHSCATHLLSGGAGLRQIQELLGHRSLVTTQKYTQVDIERLKQSYENAHPRQKSGRKKEPNAKF